MSDRADAVPKGAGPVDATGPGTAAGSDGPPRPAVIGIGILAAIAAILLAVLILQPGSEGVGEADPTPTPASEPAQPSNLATPSDSAEATPEPTASAAPTIPESWREAAVFSESGKRYVLGDLVAWSDGLIAVGTLYEEQGRGVFGPPPPRAGRVWRSTDGTEWTDVTPADTFAGVELVHLFEAADGALIVIGHGYPGLEPVSAAWETRDGETWTHVELTGIPEDGFIFQVASGGQGHVAAVSVGALSQAVHSSDGRSWEPTLDNFAVNSVAAGDEGFVASGLAAGSEEERVVASADGLEWFDANEPDGDSFLAAPRGGDWVASTTTVDFDAPSVDAPTWRSANGLDWSVAGEIPLETSDVFDQGCHEFPTVLHGLASMTVAGTILTFGCGEGAVLAAGGAYATADGAAWMRLPFGDQAFAAGAAIIGDRAVVATDARTSTAPVIGVTFWVSEP